MGIDNVADVTPRLQYVAGVAQTNFDYDFSIFTSADLIVVVDGVTKALNTDYTVTRAEEEDTDPETHGGTVTFLVAMTGGEIITIYRDIAIERSTDIAQNGPWSSVAYNDEQDKTYLLMQQIQANVDRSLRIPTIAEVDSADIIVEPANYANKYLAFDADGKPTPAVLSSTTMTQAIVGNLLYPRTAAEISAGVTPTDYSYPPGDVRRYGADPSGISDATTAINNALTVAAQGAALGYGGIVFFPAGYFHVSGLLTIPQYCRFIGSGRRATVIRRTVDTPMVNWGSFSTIEHMRLESASGTFNTDLMQITSGSYQSCYSIETANNDLRALTFAANTGSGFTAFDSSFVTTGGAGSVAAVALASGSDSSAYPRSFTNCDGEGSTMIDVAGMNNVFITGCRTEGILCTNTANEVFIRGCRIGYNGTVTWTGMQSGQVIANTFANTTLTLQNCNSIWFMNETPGLNIVESGTSSGNRIWLDGTYVPTFTTLGGGQSLGNGTITGYYSRDGRRVSATIVVQFGSTTNFGSGRFRFSLPVTADAGTYTCSAFITDNNTSNRYQVLGLVEGANKVGLFVPGGADSVDSTHPITFATSDTIWLTINYSVV
jgi:hypothetical protein